MIFAFATDEKTLMLFPSESEAVAYCEGIDVEEGTWQFFGEEGQALEAVFSKPNIHGLFSVASGSYSLRPASSGATPTLLELLPEVATVEGKPPFNTVAEIKRLLTSRSRPTEPTPKK